MCTQNEALKILQEVNDRCSDIIPIDDAYLYGSYARGDYRPYSDVDIMIVSPLSADALHGFRWDFARISSDVSIDHDVTVSLTVRSKEQFKPQSIPYHSNVMREGIRCTGGRA